MKLKINRDMNPEDFYTKSCRLGFDEVEFTENFGWNTEFIGHLKPLPMGDDHSYLFYVEKVVRDNKIGSIHVLSINNPEDRQTIIQALIHDYGIDKDLIDLPI